MPNLLVASGLMANILSAGLTVAGMPVLVMLPLGLYPVWVSGNALSGAIQKARLAYRTGGTVIRLILALTACTFAVVLTGFTLEVLGATPPWLG